LRRRGGGLPQAERRLRRRADRRPIRERGSRRPGGTRLRHVRGHAQPERLRRRNRPCAQGRPPPHTRPPAAQRAAVNVWLIAATVLACGLLPCLYVCLREPLLDAIVGLEVGAAIAALVL